MKLWSQSRTPAQLLGILAALNLLVAFSFGALALPPHHPSGPRLFLWCTGIALIAGIVLTLLTEQVLQNGIANERWPDRLLEGPRKFAAHSVFYVTGCLVIIAACIAIAGSRRWHIEVAWVFLWPALSLLRVGNYLRRKPTSTDGSLLSLIERPKPLSSEQWGTPPRSSF